MATYRKKPVDIEAVQILPVVVSRTEPPSPEQLFSEYPAWLRQAVEDKTVDFLWKCMDDWHVRIQTMEGQMIGAPHNFIIQGVQGELYPCNSQVFHATYDKV